MNDASAMMPVCPLPCAHRDVITMAHGGGGAMMHRLIEEVFIAGFSNPALKERHDAARLQLNSGAIAFTTYSYVIQPLVFPGGDIGSLAVHGTVNDLAMAGARPLYLSAGFILEEGLSVELLTQIVRSMRGAADAAGVQLVTGDTKVINRRSNNSVASGGDGIFINTAGVGVIEHNLTIGPRQVCPGDCIVVNGDLGRHGIAVMAVREGIEFESAILSDSAPLAAAVLDLIAQGVAVHCLRDLTRGGLVSAANEIAECSGLAVRLDEAAIPVRDDVRGACELLGFDPLYVANEGRFIAYVPPDHVEKALDVLRAHARDTRPAMIGTVTDEQPVRVTMDTRIGATRILDRLSGEQLPRIC